MSAGGMDEAEIFGDAPMESNEETQLPEEFATMSAEDIERRTRLLDNEIRVLRDESNRLSHQKSNLTGRIKENKEKMLNLQEYLRLNVIEL